jgi:hypothetical protein
MTDSLYAAGAALVIAGAWTFSHGLALILAGVLVIRAAQVLEKKRRTS